MFKPGLSPVLYCGGNKIHNLLSPTLYCKWGGGVGYIKDLTCFIEFIKQVRKRDKMLGLPTILSLFRTELNKINKTGA